MKRAVIVLLILLCLPLAAHAEATEDVRYYSLDKNALGAGSVRIEADRYELSDGTLTRGAYGYDGATAELSPGSTLWTDVSVEQAGWYQIALDYNLPQSSLDEVSLSLKINGKSPFYECRNIPLYAAWEDSPGEYPLDSFGNELVKTPRRVYRWLSVLLNSRSYELSRGLLFPFEAGSNRIEITISSQPVVIGAITVQAPAEPPAYRDYRAALPTLSSPPEKCLVTVEGESYSEKNHSYIRAQTSSNPNLFPYETGCMKVNALSEEGWYWPGEGVTYTFAVPEDGDYRIAVKSLQPGKDFPVFKNILIDGETPFAGLDSYAFDYTGGSEYKNHYLMADGEPALFRLSGGEHTITLTSTAQKSYEYYERLTAVMKDMSDVALDIRMVSGGSVDEYRDWDIEEYLPNLSERIEAQADELQSVYEALGGFTDKEPAVLSPLRVAATRLRHFAQEPDELVNSLGIYAEGTGSYAGSIATYLSEMLCQNMSIDRIYVLTPDQEAPAAMLGFFPSVSAAARNFLYSFKSNANYSQQQSQEGVLNVWMGRNIGYVQQMRLFIDQDFTPSTGIPVQISAMPDESKLLLAVSSGLGPDVVLSGSNYRPFDFALRGALLDLRQFDDFGEVIQAFNSETLVPFCINDSCYGLPETLSFQLMFYRKDVMEKLGLKVPETWDDVISILPTLERYGMDFGTQLASAGASKHFGVTIPFIQQFEGRVYADDGSAVALGDHNTIRAFELMCDLYTKYSLPQTVASFYASFRYGTMPIGMSDANTYILLREAAPELSELWSVAPCVGVRNAEGEVLRYQMASATSCFISSDTGMPDEAWTFLKWWMSDETQTRFGQEVRLTYGPDFVWNSANMRAFGAGAGYDEHTLSVIREQFRYIKEIPRNPAYFSVERELSNAWNKVVLQGESVRTAIDYATTQCNRVIAKKLKEFGYMDEAGILIEPFRPISGKDIDAWKEAAK